MKIEVGIGEILDKLSILFIPLLLQNSFNTFFEESEIFIYEK